VAPDRGELNPISRLRPACGRAGTRPRRGFGIADSIACLVVAVAVGACGGSGGGGSNSSSSNPSGATSTKAEFIAKADALCVAGKATAPDVAQIATLLTTVPFPRAHITAVLAGASNALHHYAALIAALPRPPADSSAIGTWLSQAEHLASLLGQLGGEAKTNRSGGLDDAIDGTLTSIIGAAGPVEKFAASYGLVDCDSF
jgi:hypothetical protein